MAPVLIIGIAMLFVGLLSLVVVPAIGFIVAPLGLLLLIAYLFGLGRSAGEPPA